MSGRLNLYGDYIDIGTAEGVKLVNNAIHNFKSSLIGTIKLTAEHAPKFIRAIRELGSQYGYEFDLKNLPTVRTVTASPTAGDPDIITFGNRINLLETFSDDNIDHARKMASVTWGDGSFVSDGPMTIEPLTLANGMITNHTPPRYTPEGKFLVRDRMHSKILAHQVMQLFDEDGQRTLEIEKDLFTWTSADGRETERDGASLVALVLSRIKPHYHVDMWAEMKKIKELTLKQHGNNPVKYLDEMKLKKLLIDEKDSTAYSDNSYVKDIFSQLMLAPVDSYALEYEQMHTRWLRGKETVTSNSLRREAIVHYTQLFNDGKWLGQHSAKDQVVILTTRFEEQSKQMTALATELGQLKASGGGGGNPTGGPRANTGKGRWMIDEWRLTKVENGKEFGEIQHPKNKSDERPYYFCEDGHFNEGKKVGMYCTHKPGDGHKEWYAAKLAKKAEQKVNRGKRDRDTSIPAAKPSPDEPSKKKLALSDSIQSALTTQLGMTPDHWKSVWDEACQESGN
jgi:hypothetical protein